MILIEVGQAIVEEDGWPDVVRDFELNLACRRRDRDAWGDFHVMMYLPPHRVLFWVIVEVHRNLVARNSCPGSLRSLCSTVRVIYAEFLDL
jgi:hypothetical protein